MIFARARCVELCSLGCCCLCAHVGVLLPIAGVRGASLASRVVSFTTSLRCDRKGVERTPGVREYMDAAGQHTARRLTKRTHGSTTGKRRRRGSHNIPQTRTCGAHRSDACANPLADMCKPAFGDMLTKAHCVLWAKSPSEKSAQTPGRGLDCQDAARTRPGRGSGVTGRFNEPVGS